MRRGERSPTHSRGTIGASPCCIASTTVARTQPEVDAPHTISVSRPASSAANGTPKNADACALTSTGSRAAAEPRVDLDPARARPQHLQRRHLAQEHRRRGLTHLVVDDRGEEHRHAAPRAPRRATCGVRTSTSSRSHASGDDGSVNPRLRSTTTTAGRSPNPAAPPKHSAIARPLQRRLAALQRRPAQRLRRHRRRAARSRPRSRASTSSSGGPKSNASASPRSARWRARSAVGRRRRRR